MSRPRYRMDHPAVLRTRELVDQMVKARQILNITQAELNEKMGYSQSGLSELESFHYPHFSVVTFIRYWDALGFDIKVTAVPKKEDQ